MLGYIRTIPDWYYRWNEGRNIFSVSLPWRTACWWSKGDSEKISAVFVLCLHFRDIWRGEPDVLICGHTVSMNLIILHCLISWCMSTLKYTRFVLVNVGYVYFLWPSYPHEAPCMQRKQIFYCLINSRIEGQAVFCVEIIILYLIYLPFFV